MMGRAPKFIKFQTGGIFLEKFRDRAQPRVIGQTFHKNACGLETYGFLPDPVINGFADAPAG